MSGGLHQKYLDEVVRQVPGSMGMLKSTWRSPSNIALVKYWGKKPVQIPANPSLSFTLSNSYTEMNLTVGKHVGNEPVLEYSFEGEKNEAFESRIRGYLRNISPDKKSVSSSQGHALMDDHPYASARYLQARENIIDLRRAIIGNDIKTFIQIAENEALTLHGLMMSSDPVSLLLKPGTLQVLSRIQQLRKEKGISVAFTLDAGPNVHLIYPGYEREKVLAFIRDELLGYCYQE